LKSIEEDEALFAREEVGVLHAERSAEQHKTIRTVRRE